MLKHITNAPKGGESPTAEDFLLMIWPKATSEDRARMMRWAELREAPWTCKAWRKLKGIRTSKHQILGYMDTHTHT